MLVQHTQLCNCVLTPHRSQWCINPNVPFNMYSEIKKWNNLQSDYDPQPYFPHFSDKLRLTLHSFCLYGLSFANVWHSNHESVSFRMDVFVESALLSSLIAWSSANRMAAMGETLLYDEICPGNSFIFWQWVGKTDCFWSCLVADDTEHAQNNQWLLIWVCILCPIWLSIKHLVMVPLLELYWIFARRKIKLASFLLLD